MTSHRFGLFSDLDDTLIFSQAIAVNYGVLPAMRRFQTQQCGLLLPPGKLKSWNCPHVVTEAEFAASIGAEPMRHLLICVAENCGIDLTPAQLDYWDREEQVSTVRALVEQLTPRDGAVELLAGMQEFCADEVHVATTSAAYRAFESLRAAKLLPHVGHIFSGQGDGVLSNGDEPVLWTPSVRPPEARERVHTCLAHYGQMCPKPSGQVYKLGRWLRGVASPRTIAYEDSFVGIDAAVDGEIGFIVCINNTGCPRRTEQMIARLNGRLGIVVYDLHQALDASRRHCTGRPVKQCDYAPEANEDRPDVVPFARKTA